MVTGSPSGNTIFRRRQIDHNSRLHRDKLENIKPTIDNREPIVYKLPTINSCSKKDRLVEDRYSQIDRENNLLLEKMESIMRRRAPKKDAPFRKSSLNGDFRRKEAERVNRENEAFLKRLNLVKPSHSTQKLENSFKQSRVYLKNCSGYEVGTESGKMMSSKKGISVDFDNNHISGGAEHILDSCCQNQEVIQ